MSSKPWHERRKPTPENPVLCYVSDYVQKPYQYVSRIVEVDIDGCFHSDDDECYTFAEPVTPIDQYIYWPGGECPVAPETLVDVIFGDRASKTNTAKNFRWNDEHWMDDNIIAYRIHVDED